MDNNLIQYLDPHSMWAPINHLPFSQRSVPLLQSRSIGDPIRLQDQSIYHILLELYPEYKKKVARFDGRLTSASSLDLPLDNIGDL